MRRFSEWRLWRQVGAQMRRLTSVPLWRRVARGRAAVAIALFALLATAALASTGFIVRAFIPPSTHSHQVQAKRPSPKDEGKWFQLSHVGKSHPAPDARANAYQQAAKLPRSALGLSARTNGGTSSQTLATTPGTWLPLGPQAISTSGCAAALNCNNYGLNSGRVTAVAVDPTNAQDVWAGAADGGVWHSTDGGATWTPITDTQSTLSIGSIAIDAHTTPHTIYVGTGEANFSGDAYWGVGVLKITINNGTPTVTQLGTSYFGGLSIGKISVLDPDPNNSNNATLLAAVSWDGQTAPVGSGANLLNVGIWRSTDGGTTWAQVIRDSMPSGACQCFYPDFGTDVVFDPAHPGTAYAGLGNVFGYPAGTTYLSRAGVYSSSDSGATWTILNYAIDYLDAAIGRTTIGLSADGTHMGVIFSFSGNTGQTPGMLLYGIVYTGVDSNIGWVFTSHDVAAVPGMMSDDGEYQWWYDDFVGIDPTDATGKTLYVGGVDIWKTTDGGSTWTNLTNVYGATPVGVHPDEHAIAFLPGSSSYYLGNDGGVWSGTSANSFTNLNAGLDITQFYAGSIGETGADPHLYGGTQDNGTTQYPNANVSGVTTWNQVLGGDGGSTIVDYTNNAQIYGEFPYGGLVQSPDAGANWYYADYNHDGNGFPGTVSFVMPVIESPNNHNELLVGTDRVYQTTNGTTSWAAISPIFDTYTCGTGICTAPISALAIAPGHDGTIYAGDFLGDVFASTDGGAHWQTNRNFFCLYSMVTALAVDPTNPNVAYATCAGFTGGAQHVYKTTDAALHWTDISGSLPDIPFEGVLVDPTNAQLVVAGSDVGVFVSQDGGSSWAQLGSGLPNVAIDQLFMNHSGTRLFVATHGRGMWELDFPHLQTSSTWLNLPTAPGVSPAAQTLTLRNTGVGPLTWTLSGPTSLPSWLSLADSSGPITPGSTRTVPAGSSDPLTLSFSIPTSDGPQTYAATLVFSDPNADNSPVAVPVVVSSAQTAKTWYFAEGYTGSSYDTFLTLANPNPSAASVQVTYLLNKGHAPLTRSYTVAATSRYTIWVNGVVGANYDVSMVVQSSLPIVAERPMYFTAGAGTVAVPSGHDALGATALHSQFAFGYLDTTANHDTWLTVLNQNSFAVDVQIAYFAVAGGPPTAVSHVAPANSRTTIHVNTEGLPAGTYSALVTLVSDVDHTTPALGLVERPLYLKDGSTGFTGAADVVGVSQPLTTWYFAEGYTDPANFAERYILSNPDGVASDPPAHASVTFYLQDGSTQTVSVTLSPGQQQIISANALLGSYVQNSAVVQADRPILAERFMSFAYGGPHWQGASDALGAAAPGYAFAFAEGYTGSGFAEYLTLENPDPSQAALVRVTYLPSNGAAPVVQTYVVGPHSRSTVTVNSVLPNQSLSLLVQSSLPIVAERPMYFVHNGTQTGGTDVLGYQPIGSCIANAC